MQLKERGKRAGRNDSKALSAERIANILIYGIGIKMARKDAKDAKFGVRKNLLRI